MIGNRVIIFFVTSIIAIFPYSFAVAANLDIHLFGHQVTITKGDDDQYRLKVDEREVLKNYYIDIEEVHVVGGTPVAVGTSSGGGNACASAPFVISFPEGQRARLDGPLDSCMPVNVGFSDDKLSFSTTPQPNNPGQKWEWNASAGFHEIDGDVFVADKSKGWDQLRERSVTHPASLLGYAEVAAEINRLAGSDKTLVNDILTGVGSGEFKGDLFVGTVCTPHMCSYQEAIVIADLRSRTVYLAWKPSGQKIKVSPPVKAWREKAKAELREWSAKWK